MRLKKPTRAIIDQVRITREGNDAIIDYADAGISGTRFTIGPDIATMTDREIIGVFNGILKNDDGPPEIDHTAVDFQIDLVEMPSRVRLRATLS